MIASRSTIYTMHGVAPNVDPRRFIYRNISDERSFRAILSARTPFVSLAESLAGRGDALTIDDATRASADAALLARKLGHQVTLFVNPGQVDPPVPYSFNLLSVLMDRLTARSVNLDGQTLKARTPAERDAVRERVKSRLREIETETERNALIARLALQWGGVDLSMPDFLETLTTSELEQLRDSGVDIQNHGWTHRCHRRHTAEESQREIDSGKQWLLDRLGVTADLFAVPFGDVLPPEGVDCTHWLTADYRLPRGQIGQTVWNRETLHADPAPRAFDRVRSRARGLIRRATRRFQRYGQTNRRSGLR